MRDDALSTPMYWARVSRREAAKAGVTAAVTLVGFVVIDAWPRWIALAFFFVNLSLLKYWLYAIIEWDDLALQEELYGL